MNKFKKEIIFRPAWDKTNSEPSKNYGVHGVDIVFALKGNKGAVTFVIFTNWQLPHIEKMEETGIISKPENYRLTRPTGADISYHSHKKIKYSYKRNNCEFLNGKKCWNDGSCLDAEEIFGKLVKEGTDGVWKELEKKYKNTFEKEDKP